MPLVPYSVYVVLVERSSRWRDVGAFFLRGGALIIVGSIATALQLSGNSRIVTENLATTELPSSVSRNSSWSESWRGLGFWLTYFRTNAGPARPEASVLFESAPVVVATFALPAIALAGLAWSRWRPRLLFALLALTSLVLMVGLYPVVQPSPIGRLLDDSYSRIVFVRGLRSGYKAGAGYSMGISVLFGVAVADLTRRSRLIELESRARWRQLMPRALPCVAVVLVTLGAAPFWTGSLYSASDQLRSTPGYWRQAIAAVNGLPGTGRVLILPGAERNRYRWGYLGDDQFDASLTHPHVLRQSFSQGSAEAGSLLAALDDRTANDVYEPGSFAPIARLLGIRWVLIRNDLAWQQMGAARPSQLTGLRRDAALHLVQTFGAPGENTAAEGDSTALLLGERGLAPVELYEVSGQSTPVQLLPPGPPTLVSGDGNAVVTLGLDGALDSSPGFRFTASTSDTELRKILVAGAPLARTFQ